jgi:prevent-host-death family protein
MKTYTVHQAKSQLSKLIKKALRGEEIVITNRHRPVVRLAAIRAPKRRLGFLGKDVWISPDFSATPDTFRRYR